MAKSISKPIPPKADKINCSPDWVNLWVVIHQKSIFTENKNIYKQRGQPFDLKKNVTTCYHYDQVLYAQAYQCWKKDWVLCEEQAQEILLRQGTPEMKKLNITGNWYVNKISRLACKGLTGWADLTLCLMVRSPIPPPSVRRATTDTTMLMTRTLQWQKRLDLEFKKIVM